MKKELLNNSNSEILVHTCCADCLLNTIEYIQKESNILDLKITSLYFNPNIQPRSEYLARLDALKKTLREKLPDLDIKLVVPNYKPKEYFDKIKGTKNRCLMCWELRLTETFKYAKEKNFKNVTTTLLTSHYQNRDEIFKIATDINRKYNLNFIDIDSSHNCKHHGFYKQNYCGCCFSLTEKLLSKF